jgi:hypothetical protein
LRYVVREIGRDKRRALALDALPEGLTEYYTHYWAGWRDRDLQKWDETYLPLLGTLAAAKGVVSVKELAIWSGAKIPVRSLRRLLNKRWRPFLNVLGSSRRRRYQFYHPTMRELFEGRVEWEDLTASEQDFVAELRLATIDACRRIIQKAQDPEVRRDAAFRLTRLRWLDEVDVKDVDPDELLAYLELIVRSIHSAVEREYLVQSITSFLESELSERQRAQFIVYREALLA